ncbi:MAG: flagellar motor stator protein MotA [Alphaproteobacteria bacterium]|nr:flagellar motor stator protein MotA [Alphaproteobacteria bacterium]
MLSLVGIAVLFVMVFGGYILAGGKLGIILKALPFELMMIGGAAVAAMLISSSMDVVKSAVAGFGRVISGPRWKAEDYRDLLCLLYLLTKLIKTKGNVAIEPHIEKPEESTIFTRFPRILNDHFAKDFICDTFRMMILNVDDPHQVEDTMEKQLEKHHHEALGGADALTGMADGLPALGIVAAVLGVIKTMASIDQPPEILGKMIGGALVGTFLGVFLAYGLVGPFATRLKACENEDFQFYTIIRDAIVAHLKGNPAQISVEMARGNVPSTMQPSFSELEEAINNLAPA